jgi:transcriptional regulator with XRE-family HTH domain
MKDLADRLIKARTDKGMTQDDLAKAAGVSQSTIGNLESRLRRSARKLAVIANVLGVDAYWLETGEGSPQAQPADQLLEQISALTAAERSVVAAVVMSLRGVSVGARPGSATDASHTGDDAHERRILGLIRQLDERGKRDAEVAIEEIIRAGKEFAARADDAAAGRDHRRQAGEGKTRHLGPVEPARSKQRNS